MIIAMRKGEAMATFKERFNFLKTEKEVNLETIANAVNTNKSSLSMFVNGHLNIKKDLLESLAEYFDVDVSYLIGESDIRRRKNEIPAGYFGVCKKAYEAGISYETLEGFIDFYKQNRPK